MVFGAKRYFLDADNSIKTSAEKKQDSNCPLTNAIEAVLEISLPVVAIVEALLRIVYLFSCKLLAVLVPIVKGEILTYFHYWPAQIASITFFSSSIT